MTRMSMEARCLLVARWRWSVGPSEVRPVQVSSVNCNITVCVPISEHVSRSISIPALISAININRKETKDAAGNIFTSVARLSSRTQKLRTVVFGCCIPPGSKRVPNCQRSGPRLDVEASVIEAWGRGRRKNTSEWKITCRV